MFIVLRKSNLILFSVIVLVFGYTVSLWATQGETEEVVATFAAPASGRVIVIDAGHGGYYKANIPHMV